MAGLDVATLLSTATRPECSSARDNLLHAEKMTALGELASGITHDFRNILQTIIATLDILESRSNDPAEVRRLVASALRTSERGVGLTQRLLRFSRREATVARPTCLLASLEGVTETLARTIEARMNVGMDPPPANLWPVVIDPIEFEMALVNLGLNARDAMPRGGRIRLERAQRDDPHYRPPCRPVVDAARPNQSARSPAAAARWGLRGGQCW